jgi:hypothetical protein
MRNSTAPADEPDDDEIFERARRPPPTRTRFEGGRFRQVNGSAMRRPAPADEEEEEEDEDVEDKVFERVRPPTRRARFEEDLMSNLPNDEPIGRVSNII